MVGKRIRMERRKLNLTQEQAAERTDITGQYWSLIERGRYSGSVNTYLQIASALGVTLDDLFYNEAIVMRMRKAFSYDSLFDDCSEYEHDVIIQTLCALKGILLRTRTSIPVQSCNLDTSFKDKPGK